MENEIMEMQNEEVMEVYEEPEETTGNGLLGKIVAGAVVVAIGAGALIYKNRNKLEERRIKKLEKKGYVIMTTDEYMDRLEVAETEETEE